MRGQHTEQTLQLVGDGVQTITDIDVSARERLKAAELIGKRYGMFKDNLDVGGSIPVVISGVMNLKIKQAKQIFLPDYVGKGYGTFWRWRGRYRVCKEAVQARNPKQPPFGIS